MKEIFVIKKGPKIAPLGETLPKKHLHNFTLEDANLNVLIKARLKIKPENPIICTDAINEPTKLCSKIPFRHS